MSLQEIEGRLAGAAVYATALFEQGRIERYLDYFCRLLLQMTADDDLVIDDLELLAEGERRQLLYDWNNTQAEFLHRQCIHELFEAQVEKTPDATAVVFEEDSLSYGELNHRANQLAHYLRKLGVKPETRVAICLERSLEMVVALFAVLKAGGAYVPLDPSHPQERLHYMLEDTQAAFVLTQANLEEKLTGLLPAATRLIALDCQWDEISESVAELKTQNIELRRDVNPHHLAYVIYTSGSTGLSKGVMVEHQSVVNLFFGLKNSIYRADKTDGFRVSVNGPLIFSGFWLVVSPSPNPCGRCWQNREFGSSMFMVQRSAQAMQRLRQLVARMRCRTLGGRSRIRRSICWMGSRGRCRWEQWERFISEEREWRVGI
jgi:non-ribosomal peptide synthetase component F